MGSIKTHQDLRVWQVAKSFSDEVGKLSRSSSFARDFAVREQLNRAALSTVANIAEGYFRARRKEFIHFLSIARGSNGEAPAVLEAAQGRDSSPTQNQNACFR